MPMLIEKCRGREWHGIYSIGLPELVMNDGPLLRLLGSPPMGGAIIVGRHELHGPLGNDVRLIRISPLAKDPEGQKKISL